MCKLNKKNDSRKIDPCLVNLMFLIKAKAGKIRTLACCCGHGKYPMTIVVTNGKTKWDLISNKIIPRKKKFYKKDKQGYYYIPEVIEE